VEITERMSDGEITRIIGHFAHNDLCEQAVLKRLPAIPLHEHVYEVALTQLEDGAKCVTIQIDNVIVINVVISTVCLLFRPEIER
jgi:hypothetical protein